MTEQQRAAQVIVTRRDDTAGGSHLSKVQSHYFLRGEHTGGAFSLTEILFQPGAQGTPMHVHTREEETYYVIEGELQIDVGDERVVLGPGGSVVQTRHLRPKVTPTPDRTTRVLMIITPPGLEGMLMQLDEVGSDGLDMAALSRLSDDYGVQALPD